ncbi:DEAD/DEAH box helicase [Streptomyces chrestomyceticus]|uniref:DEAD/DEAH box helicase n=1 Tax=Streptomyces chrestomyceticus TaxID=68185 RepID=UPI001F49845E|nr:DEAD/DEAH box helicase [Streptomyces chrestomyceticus]
MTLPVALAGSDVIGQAKTGTGKTLGFGLPLLERVTVPADVEAGRAKPEQLTEAPQALVVVPTRELCQQVTNDLLTAGKVRNVRVLSIYGGRAYEPQVEALKKGVDVVVGTPGRLLDLAGQKKLNLSHVKALVLDEADEMLDLGFLPDVERIINMLPVRRQTMLFSATMPGAVIGLARRYMSQPTHIRAAAPDDEGQTVANIKQHVFRAHSMDKPEMVSRILQSNGRGLAMIFCRTKRTAADIADQLARRGFASGAVHGDLGQGAREQALRAFRNGKVDVLVCTDVAARGIDVEGVTHVVNYQSPEDEKTYLHRIGRTGRAGAKGIAITLVDWDDIPRWKLINKALDLPFDEPEETYSTSAHLYELLEIPEGTTGVLPRAERKRAGLAAEEVEDLGETGGRGRGPRRGAPAVEEERPRRSRTPRQRRRTRGGALVDGVDAPETSGTSGAPEGGASATDGPRQPRRRRRTRGGSGNAPAAVTPARDQAAPAAETVASEAAQTADANAPSSKPRRRRTRGGANSAAKAETARTAAATAVDTVEGPTGTVKVPAQATAEAPVVAEAPAITEPVADEAPAKPRRRTRSAKPAAEAVVEAVESAEPVAVAETAAVAEPVADEAPAKPRRTRKTAAAKKAEAAVETVEAAEPVADEAPAKPRRTRKTAAAKKAEAAVETAEGAEVVADEAAAKPRRTRKTAAAKAEAAPAADAAADEAPAKPRRTRKTAAAKAAEEAAESAEPVADEAPAKPRRTRKTAATKKAEAAVDTAEGTEAAADEAPAKPRRTRKTAATKKAEAAVDAAETVADEAAAKPRRTRKTAAKKATAEAPAADAGTAAEDDAPAKPRRARKTAAAKAEAAPAADAAADEAPAKPRRTRKTAAKKATAEAPAEG